MAIPNPDYDPRGDRKKNEFLLFATSKRVPEEYRRRWNIETGYRVKNEFKIRTCSKKGVARVLFFVVQSIMHNFLNVQKSILSIAAYELKSLITEGIQKYLCDGKFVNTVSIRAFYAKMAGTMSVGSWNFAVG
ncbi:hypothetical protein CW714_00290 [Methanophagales archaeon]|nr:MAG: hypothetical protein CW714_00290 [Methanophagales archaeon]